MSGFLLTQLDYSFLYSQIGALCLADFEKYKNVEGEIDPEFKRTHEERSQAKRERVFIQFSQAGQSRIV